VLALTDCIGRAVSDADGIRVGRLSDVGVRLEDAAAVVTSLHVRRSRRAPAVVVSWARVAAFETTDITLSARCDALGQDPSPPDDLRLVRDVLDAQIVDVAGARVVRVGDVDLDRRDGALRVVAVEVGWAALLRRLGLRRLADRVSPESIAWQDVHLASGRAHALLLSTPSAAVHRMRRAELTHLVAELPSTRSAEVLRAVGPERAAAAISGARPGASGRLLETLGPQDAAPIVAAMRADDAVAALREVDPETRRLVLDEVASARASELRRLLGHPPGSAAGLMSSDVFRAGSDEPLDAVRARLTASRPRLEGLATVFVVDGAGRPVGTFTPLMLLAGDARPAPALTVRADAPVQAVVDLFAMHDVLAVAVVDAMGRVIGAVAVDDVLEELLAERLPGRHGAWFAATRRRHAA
jgi:sporulation protein YlmC with PRC-barrel domain/CBS domain-containing protein